MANIIIPPEHQAAPKTMPLMPVSMPMPSVATGKSYDDELDHPMYHHPEVLAWEQREPGKSTDGMIEESLRQHHINEQKVKSYRWAGQERWQGRHNEEARLVRIMHPHTFIRRLQQAGIAASLGNETCDAQRRDGVAEPLDDGTTRLWLNEYVRLGRVGVNAWVKPPAGSREWRLSRKVARTVTTLQYAYGPEYSVMRFDAYNLPTNEKYRGWRTALLVLILAEVLTEAEAERAFGPTLGPAGEFYREQLYSWRAMKLGVKER